MKKSNVYFVNQKPFDDLLDAISYCKKSPKATLTDSFGTILMFHEQVSLAMFKDICLAKEILKGQLS